MPLPKTGQTMEEYLQGFMSDPAMVEKHPDEKQRYAIGVSEWEKVSKMACGENKNSECEPETMDIDEVEIFSAGTWNGDKYSEVDLDNIVTAFGETKDTIKPYLKIGHNSQQALLNADELPAAGWVENLRKSGDKLVADFKRVPKKIYQLIKAGAYRKVSAEIYWDLKQGDKTYPYALKAVALLGATAPAVKNLKDIMALYAERYAVNYASDAKVKAYEMENAMEKEIEALKNTVAEKEAALTEANAKVAEFSEKVATLEKEITEMKQEKRFAEIDAKVDTLVSNKKIAPAAKAKLTAILRNIPAGIKGYSEDGKDLSLEDTVLAFAEMGEVALKTEQETVAGAKDTEDIADKAKKYSADNGISYKEALIKLSREAK